MKRFPGDIYRSLEAGEALIVGTAQRAAAVRSAYGEAQIAAGAGVWETPQVTTFQQWANSALVTAAQCGPQQVVRVLSGREEWALCRSIAAELVPSHEYLTQRALAAQLRSALRLVDEWQIDPARIRSSTAPEAQLLSTAMVSFEQRCVALGARPSRQLWATLAVASPPLIPTTLILPTAQRRVLERLGAKIVDPPVALGQAQFLACQSVETECSAIATWCKTRLQQQPRSRLLLIAPDLASRRAELERSLSQTLEPSRWLGQDDGSRAYAVEGGRPLADFALVRHALTTLALLTRPLPFADVSSWLQAAFHHMPGDEHRATLDSWLRRQGRLELGAPSLLACLARAPTVLTISANAMADQLTRALGKLSSGKRSTREWAQSFSGALEASGWPGERVLSSVEQQTRRRWNELLVEFASVASSLGAMQAVQAADCIGELAADVRFDAASADVPIVVTDSFEPPVVRYDAIWVMGLDSGNWPPPPSPHVLVPTRLQIEAGIPTASAAGQRALAERAMQDWRASTDWLVGSAPLTRDDAEMQPSVLVSGWTKLPDLIAEQDLATQMRGAPAFNYLDDSYGSAWPSAEPVRRGVAVFDLQTRCPFKAYAELRLTADPLELPEPGIDARKRGSWLHSALEIFWQGTQTHAALLALSDEDLQERAQRAVISGLRKVEPLGDADLLARSVGRERERLVQLLLACAELDRGREPFTVVATERQFEAQIAGGRFRFKVDRIDQLAGAAAATVSDIALIDYKSGKPGGIGWLEARVREPQLLVYSLAYDQWAQEQSAATQPAGRVAALARLHLTRGVAKYLGLSGTDSALPNVTTPDVALKRSRRSTRYASLELTGETPSERWDGAVQRWHGIVTNLADDYLNGVAIVDPFNRQECQYCHLKTLCRRAELALRLDADDDSDDDDSEDNDS
ncbi:MAG: PD-(D/E)XK nuclease family protein [Proteobacteria bacterium]|nr:PD-(D/E)XK nuclease family protein [Pseudomonadota bacterium]